MRAPAKDGPVRLVATDLDGTLLGPDGRVTPRTSKAVAAARRAGIHVVPVTGRPPQAMWDLADAAGLGPVGVCSNGAVVVDLEERSVTRFEPLAAEIAIGLVRAVRDVAPGILLAVDNLDGFSYEPGFFRAPDDWQEELLEVPDIVETLGDGCIKLIARLPGRSAVELIGVLEASIAEEGHITTSGLDWVDIGAPGVSKAYALERVCDQLGVHVTEVAAIGDNHNDLSVLGWAGTALAPGNAIPDVLAMVDRILPANHDEGVAFYLEELVASLEDHVPG